VYRGSADDVRDGFIHFSTASSGRDGEKAFSARPALFLIEVELNVLGPALALGTLAQR